MKGIFLTLYVFTVVNVGFQYPHCFHCKLLLLYCTVYTINANHKRTLLHRIPYGGHCKKHTKYETHCEKRKSCVAYWWINALQTWFSTVVGRNQRFMSDLITLSPCQNCSLSLALSECLAIPFRDLTYQVRSTALQNVILMLKKWLLPTGLEQKTTNSFP